LEIKPRLYYDARSTNHQVLTGFLTPDDGTGRISRNVVKKLPLPAA